MVKEKIDTRQAIFSVITVPHDAIMTALCNHIAHPIPQISQRGPSGTPLYTHTLKQT